MINYIPTINQKELKGGIIYFDGRFDDARMAIRLAKTTTRYVESFLNYMKVEKIKKIDRVKRHYYPRPRNKRKVSDSI